MMELLLRVPSVDLFSITSDLFKMNYKNTIFKNWHLSPGLMSKCKKIEKLDTEKPSNFYCPWPSSSLKVSWFKFILLWFVISKWNFLQSALDWLTLSWTFCFYFEADNNVCWHVFCFNCVGTPQSYLYESSNHNTKYMSAKEILSERGKIPLM